MESIFQLENKENTSEEEYNKYAKLIIAPYDHINESKGKRVRNNLIKIYNHWLKVDQNHANRIADIIQWAHTLSLLIDDIQDESELRRGNSAAHIIYGAGRTISAVDLSTDIIYPRARDYASSQYIKVAFNCITNIFLGQVMEIYWRDNFVCPTEEEYIYMINRKTGCAFQALNLCLELFSTTNLNLNNVSVLVGIYFQLCDDYNALKSIMCCKSKGFCDDIREGKYTLPMVHAIHSHPNNKRVLNILKMRTTDINLKNECLKLLEEFGSLQHTKNTIHYFKDLILQEINILGPNPNFKELFEAIDIKSDE